MLNIKDFMAMDNMKSPKLLRMWLILICFIIILLIGINKVFYLNHYYICEGIIDNGYIKISVPTTNMGYIINNKKISIDDKEYNYSVKEIDKEIYNVDTILYQTISLKVKLDKSLIDNRVVNTKFILGKKTILQYIVDFIKGGKHD